MTSRSVQMPGIGVLIAVLLAGASAGVLAEGQDKPTKDKAAKPLKVTGPYAKLDLKDEQRAQIAAIQKDIAEQIAALKRQERERILAVLTEQQRATLHRMADHQKLKKRIWGMKGYLKRLENRRAKLEARQAQADGREAEKLADQVQALEKKIADYRAKLADEQATLDALSDK